MDENIIINDGTISSGNVKITLIKDGKEIDHITVHNEGTVYLCEYILNALIGDYVIAKRPDIIVPFTRGSGKNVIPIGNGSPSIGTKVTIPASYWETHLDENGDDGGFCAAVITFLIPSSIISGSQIDGFQLLSKDNSRKVYAIVELPEGGSITTVGETNLKVEWTMYVSYKWDINKEI